MTLIAYHNDPTEKAAILIQLEKHRKADELVKGQYWQDGKGCAVGCALHSSDHMEYEPRFGIPVMLAHLEDRIFEGLANAEAKAWPERFMGAITPGTDLSRVGWQFLHWILTDEKVNPGINHPLVRDAVKACAAVMGSLAEGVPLKKAACAAESAGSAASAAESAARSAAESAARSAEWSAAWSAGSAASAAESAASAARSAAESAASAASAASAESAESAAYSRMADKLVELLHAT